MSPMQVLQRHPVCKLFPPLSADEFEALVEDIRQNGVKVPVLVHQGQVLDGWHRYQACQRLGIECPTREWDGSEPWLTAKSLNMIRRHLRPDQVDAIRREAERRFPEVAALTAQDKEDAKQRQREHRAGQLAPDGAKSGKTSDAVARRTGVSARTVERGNEVEKVAPELIPKVAAGEMSYVGAQREMNKGKTTASKVLRVPKQAPAREELGEEMKVALAESTRRLEATFRNEERLLRARGFTPDEVHDMLIRAMEAIEAALNRGGWNIADQESNGGAR